MCPVSLARYHEAHGGTRGPSWIRERFDALERAISFAKDELTAIAPGRLDDPAQWRIYTQRRWAAAAELSALRGESRRWRKAFPFLNGENDH